jgi:hypothetical protein
LLEITRIETKLEPRGSSCHGQRLKKLQASTEKGADHQFAAWNKFRNDGPSGKQTLQHLTSTIEELKFEPSPWLVAVLCLFGAQIQKHQFFVHSQITQNPVLNVHRR